MLKHSSPIEVKKNLQAV